MDEPDLIADPDEKALAEARNALRQFDIGMVLLDHWLDNKAGKPRLRVSDLLYLNRFALEDINRFAGTFRTQNVKISGSKHVPPAPQFVPALCEDLCDYVNRNWNKKSPIHLSAYVLWRINWIHPFADGNGRTARILSYIILCAKYGFRLPGSNTIPEQIVSNKKPYYKALEDADSAFESQRIDVRSVENLIEYSLREQIEASIKSTATLSNSPSPPVKSGELFVVDESRTQKIMLTLKVEPPEERKNFLERNPTLWTGVFSIVSAIAAVFLTKLVGG